MAMSTRVVTLDARNQSEIVQPTCLDMQLIEGGPNGRPLRMLILSGIAIVRWDSQANLDPEIVNIHVGKFNAAGPAFALQGQSSTVALTSVTANEGDFTFGIDSIEAEIYTATGDVLLNLAVDIAVQGSNLAVINTFSYHSHVIYEELPDVRPGQRSFEPFTNRSTP
jgi:hypothetical protein